MLMETVLFKTKPARVQQVRVIRQGNPHATYMKHTLHVCSMRVILKEEHQSLSWLCCDVETVLFKTKPAKLQQVRVIHQGNPHATYMKHTLHVCSMRVILKEEHQSLSWLCCDVESKDMVLCEVRRWTMATFVT